MDEGSSSPKTLADVSHLFFSRVEESAEEPQDAAVELSVPEDDQAVDETPQATRLFVVTGGSDSPGKSTIAVNLATALAPFGRVGVFDADPSVPNARYFLGLPSWHYLSHLTGADDAPNVVTDTGLVVTDWAGGAGASDGAPDAAGLMYIDVPESGREPLDFAVVDVPATRTDLLARLASFAPLYVVAARPGLRGFESAYAALRTLRLECSANSATLVVNGAPSERYATAFCAKMKVAAERLLSMDVQPAGAVLHEPGLGAEQRERGAIVASRPDSAAALSLRRIATDALELMGSAGQRAR